MIGRKIRQIHVILLTLLVTLLVIATGCATRITLSSFVPAEHDMSAYRAIIIDPVAPYRFSLSNEPPRRVEDFSSMAPVQVYTGHQLSSGRSAAATITRSLTEMLVESPFISVITLSDPDVHSSSVARVQTRIDTIDVDEYIFARKSGEAYTFHLRQRVGITLSYHIIAVESGSEVYRGSVRRINERTYDLDTDTSQVIFAPSLTPLLEEMAVDAATIIAERIVPQRVTTRVALLKPDTDSHIQFEEAYVYATEAKMRAAYDTFALLWREQQDPRAGYNAALIAESIGLRTTALSLMEKVVENGSVSRAQRQLERMSQTAARHEEAELQIYGSQ